MSDAPNPYTPPKVDPPAATHATSREELGVVLPLVLLGFTVLYVSVACSLVYDFQRHELPRGGVLFALAACCLWMLFLRRFAVIAYFFLSVAAIPLNVFWYGASPGITLSGFAVPALVVLALVWNKAKMFRGR